MLGRVMLEVVGGLACFDGYRKHASPTAISCFSARAELSG